MHTPQHIHVQLRTPEESTSSQVHTPQHIHVQLRTPEESTSSQVFQYHRCRHNHQIFLRLLWRGTLISEPKTVQRFISQTQIQWVIQFGYVCRTFEVTLKEGVPLNFVKI